MDTPALPASAARLLDTIGAIEQIRISFNAPSVAVGVIDQDQVVFSHGWGICDAKSSRVPDEETVYSIGSCTKAVTTTALDLLRQEGRFSWEKPIHELIPAGFETPGSPIVGQQATTVDALTHSTGLSPLLFACIGRAGRVFVEANKIIGASAALPKLVDFRSSFIYNNWMFALASQVGESIVKQPWGQYLSSKLLEPLGLDRSTTMWPKDDNYARGFITLDDGTTSEVPIPDLKAGDAFDGSGSIRSCVKDMLRWTQYLMDSSKYANVSFNTKPAIDSLPENYRNALAKIQEPQFPLANDRRQSYGLGLFVMNLPTTEFNNVTNNGLITQDWILGEHSPPRHAVGHTGALGSFVAAYWTFPESKSSVVVLANVGVAEGDVSNIIAQTLIQALFDMTPKVDLVAAADQIRRNARRQWNGLVNDWHASRSAVRTQHSPSVFQDVFRNQALGIEIAVTARHGVESFRGQLTELEMQVNGDDTQTYQLFNYQADEWSFMPETRDDCVRRGLEIYMTTWQGFNVRFEGFKDGAFTSLVWRYGENGPADDTVFERVASRAPEELTAELKRGLFARAAVWLRSWSPF